MSYTGSGKLLWPFAAATILTPEYAANIVLEEIYNNKTIVRLPALTGNTEIDLTLDAELRPGAELIIEANQGGTGRDVVLGDGFEGSGITGVLNDKDTIYCVYNGSSFRVVSVHKTVDAA